VQLHYVATKIVRLTVSGVGYDYDREFLIIYTEETLTPDLPFTLTIQFVR
jgi:hypothetical protein